jgi:hypothetical protein
MIASLLQTETTTIAVALLFGGAVVAMIALLPGMFYGDDRSTALRRLSAGPASVKS